MKRQPFAPLGAVTLMHAPLSSPLSAMVAALLLASVSTAHAQDKAEVAPSQIIGNRELPKVLVIVPWKKPLSEPTVGKPPVSVLDEALAPIDRDVFRRQQAYLNPVPTAAKP